VSDSDPNANPTEDLGETAETDEAYCAACNQSFTIDALFCPNDGAKLVKLKARPDTLIGRVLENRFEVRTPLGHGGMGTVYRGWQLSVDREVAIKVIHPKLATDRNVAKRFFREARLASRLSQANIVNVYEFGQTDDGILYLAMELLRGRPLSKDLEAMRPLPMKRIKAIGMQMCDALDAAHSQGIIHRDLKPGNIVILDDPRGRDLVKILDFGLAKSLVQDNISLVTRTDVILGTPLYMPPEQILGKPSDQTADLYSLGCILYQLATGRPPYVGENVNVVLASHVRDPVPEVGANAPSDLRALIQRLMMKEPRDRFQTARDVHAAIEALGDDPESQLMTRAWTGPPPQDAPSDVIRSVATPSAVGLATPGTTNNSALDRPPVSRRWLLPLIALVVLGGVAVLAFLLLNRGARPTTGQTGQTGPSGSALDPQTPDAEQTSPDVTVAVDAAAANPDGPGRGEATPDARALAPDAQKPNRPSRRDAGVVTPPRPDAALAAPDAAPTIEIRDAGVPKPDAKIDIELIDTNKKKS